MRAMSFGRVFFGSKFLVGMAHFLRKNPRLCIALNFASVNVSGMNLPHAWQAITLTSAGASLLNIKYQASRRCVSPGSGAHVTFEGKTRA
jgi:hypothetical protein